MNAKRKKAALKVFSELPAETTKEEMKKIILADANGYTEDEANEIIEALESYKGEEEPGSEEESVSKAPKKVHYQEWDVKISNGKAEKLKIKRPVVKISESEAEILNAGALQGGSQYAVMYYMPE